MTTGQFYKKLVQRVYQTFARHIFIISGNTVTVQDGSLVVTAAVYRKPGGAVVADISRESLQKAKSLVAPKVRPWTEEVENANRAVEFIAKFLED